MKSIRDKRILIIGGTGSLGKTLIRRLIKDNKVCVFSRDESKHWTIRNEMSHKNLTFFVGDVRDKSRCLESILTFKPSHIILAAALKHVDVCENSPLESLKTNTLGVNNIVDIVKENESIQSFVESVLMVSTDKACSPINVYGMCKSIAERIVTSASSLPISTKFIAVRYGNVLESRGSIIPLFKYQSENCDNITITDDRMTRFVMTLDESVDLITTAINNGKSGETWVPKLPSMRIKDLAKIFSRLSNNKPILSIGIKPGEKLHEDLINFSESMRTRKIGKYLVISSAFTVPFCEDVHVMRSDDNLMSIDALEEYLTGLGILKKPTSQFIGKSIEEIGVSNLPTPEE